jgi:carbohydrate diacid regulator
MINSVIQQDIAQRFVDRLCERLPYNINVMDFSGTIIAARDPERRGTYHEAAYRICNESIPEIVIEPGGSQPPGTLPGINLPIAHEGETIGVVGITGDPREVALLSQAVKTAIETMVEHELYKEFINRRQDKKKTLINMLLFGDDRDVEEASELARQLGYDPERPRLPLLIPLEQNQDRKKMLAAIKSNPLHTKQDISAELPDGNLVIFKTVTLPEVEKIRMLYHRISEYAAGLLESLRTHDQCSDPTVYCGSLQVSFDDYRQGYQHTEWLQRNISGERFAGVCYFYDFFYEYLAHFFPREEITTVFRVFLQDLDNRTLSALRETILAFVQQNGRIKDTAAALHMHRNTILQRLNRITEIFGLDPIHSEYDRTVLFALFYGFEHDSSS